MVLASRSFDLLVLLHNVFMPQRFRMSPMGSSDPGLQRRTSVERINDKPGSPVVSSNFENRIF